MCTLQGKADNKEQFLKHILKIGDSKGSNTPFSNDIRLKSSGKKEK